MKFCGYQDSVYRSISLEENVHRSKVLFVGDSLLGQPIQLSLSAEGIETTIISSVRLARETIRKSDSGFNFLLVGSRIQEDDDIGIELIGSIKKNGSNLKIIFIGADYEAQKKAKDAGADECWEPGPSFFDELVQKIKSLST